MVTMKKKYIIMISIVVFISILTASVYFYKSSRDIDKVLDKIFSMPTTYTVEQAEKDGFVNLNDIRDGKDKSVEKFLENVRANKWDVLKTIKTVDNEFVLVIYINDNRVSLIKTFTYNPKTQGGIDFNNCFSQEYNIIEDGDVNQVWLTNVETPGMPKDIFIDEILYSYYRK